jgi:cardiolipin synthase
MRLESSLLALVHLFLALIVSAHILLHKRQPRSAMLWLLWVWIAPLAGSALYLYLGVNRVGPVRRKVPRSVQASSPGFDALAASVAGTPLRRGNRVHLLVDGTEGYPAMLKEIRAARISIDLETYIFDLDAVGSRFLAALEDAARRGVRVRVLVDGMGAYSARRPLKRGLRQAGGEARHYWRLDRLFRQPLLNLRNHRKLLVVDGSVAFTGGLNISQRYAKGAAARLRDLHFLARGRPAVRDVHFRFEGPLVGDLAECFQRDWAHSGGVGGLIPAARPSRRLGRAGSAGVDGVAARVVASGPDEDLERIYEVLLGALASARRSVDLCTPYFIPDAVLLSALRVAGFRGVAVRVFVPRASDHPFVHWAGAEYYRDLLDAGVEIWEVGPPFIHSKLAVVDRNWVFLGSSNLDIRSFRLNFEMNVETRSRELARQVGNVLEAYREGAHLIDHAALRRRSVWRRLRGALANLAAPYL